MHNKKIVFIIPDPSSFHSGGNLYNAALINALKHKGANVQQIEFEKINEKEVFGNKKPRVLFWDTLYFDRLDVLKSSDKNYLIVHHLESLYPPKNWTSKDWFEQKEREKLENFDGFLVSSPFTKKYLQAKGFDEKQILVIPPALLSKPIITRRKYESIHAIMVANLQERKGILPFLEALAAKVKGQHLTCPPSEGVQGEEFGEKSNVHPTSKSNAQKQNLTDLNFKLTIIGNANIESEYAQKCLDLIKSHPFLQKCIHFKGVLSPAEVLKMYEKSNLYISTSFMETFGMSMQEAAASGMPLLVYNGGNAAFHVKNGQNGTVFEDMESLVEGLFSLIGGEKKCNEMGKQAFNLAQKDRYDWAAAAHLFFLNF